LLALAAADRHWPALIATGRHWPPLTGADRRLIATDRR
jgi:hypothetical protein